MVAATRRSRGGGDAVLGADGGAVPGGRAEDEPDPLHADAVESTQRDVKGLTVVVGPPGTGKTDTAVQAVSNIAHVPQAAHAGDHALQHRTQRRLREADDPRHRRAVPPPRPRRGAARGEGLLARRPRQLHAQAPPRAGARRDAGETLEVDADVGYTCETAQYFYLSSVLAKWEEYQAALKRRGHRTRRMSRSLPVRRLLADAPPPLFGGTDAADAAAAAGCFRHIQKIFDELTSAARSSCCVGV